MRDPHQIGIMAAGNIAQNKFIVALTSIGIQSETVDDGILLLVDKPKEIVRATGAEDWRT